MSQRGLQGDVRLTDLEGGRVKVTANLSVAEGAEGEYTWGIYEFPIDYTQVRFKWWGWKTYYTYSLLTPKLNC